MKPRYVDFAVYPLIVEIEDEKGNPLSVRTNVDVEERVNHEQDEDGWYITLSACVNKIRILDDIPESLFGKIEEIVKSEMEKKAYDFVKYDYVVSKDNS